MLTNLEAQHTIMMVIGQVIPSKCELFEIRRGRLPIRVCRDGIRLSQKARTLREKGQGMSIKVNILYPPLKQFTDNQEVVKAEGSTVGECLDHLVKQFPGIEKGLFDRQGHVLNYVYFFINGKGAYPADLSKPLTEGDELTISLLLPGG